MAMPMLAAASTGGSLMPSPTLGDLQPFVLEFVDDPLHVLRQDFRTRFCSESTGDGLCRLNAHLRVARSDSHQGCTQRFPRASNTLRTIAPDRTASHGLPSCSGWLRRRLRALDAPDGRVVMATQDAESSLLGQTKPLMAAGA